jgi:hypothetical protein
LDDFFQISKYKVGGKWHYHVQIVGDFRNYPAVKVSRLGFLKHPIMFEKSGCYRVNNPLPISIKIWKGYRVEILQRVGPFVAYSLTKLPRGPGELVRTLTYPMQSKTVKILAVSQSLKNNQISSPEFKRAKVYITIMQDEYYKIFLYCSSLAEKDWSVQNVVIYIKRNIHGIALVTKELQSSWFLDEEKVADVAFVIMCMVKMNKVKYDKIEKKLFDPSRSAFSSGIRSKVDQFPKHCLLTYPFYLIYDYFKKHDQTRRLVKFVDVPTILQHVQFFNGSKPKPICTNFPIINLPNFNLKPLPPMMVKGPANPFTKPLLPKPPGQNSGSALPSFPNFGKILNRVRGYRSVPQTDSFEEDWDNDQEMVEFNRDEDEEPEVELVPKYERLKCAKIKIEPLPPLAPKDGDMEALIYDVSKNIIPQVIALCPKGNKIERERRIQSAINWHLSYLFDKVALEYWCNFYMTYKAQDYQYNGIKPPGAEEFMEALKPWKCEICMLLNDCYDHMQQKYPNTVRQEVACNHVAPVPITLKMDETMLEEFRVTLQDDTDDAPALKAIKEKAKACLPQFPFEVTVNVYYIRGGPGTGKSVAIRSLADPARDLIVAPFSKLMSDYQWIEMPNGDREKFQFKTQHRAMCCHEERGCGPHDRVFVDEFTSLPYEFLVTILHNQCATKLFLFGDIS